MFTQWLQEILINYPYLIVMLPSLILGILCVRVVAMYHRVAIFRLGRFLGVRGPGLVLRIPLVDKLQDVNLNESLPEWHGLSKEDVDEMVKSFVLSKPR